MTAPTATTTVPTADLEDPTMTTTDTALPGLVRSEVIKAATVRAPRVLVAGTAIVGLLASWAAASFAADKGVTGVEAVLFPMAFTAVLAAVGAIVLFTSEVQHGTLPGALAAHPSRWPVAAAKAVVVAGFGLVLWAIGLATGFLGALVGGATFGDASGLAAGVAWALLYVVGAALLGLGVGMVVRHGAGAISGLLAWWLVIEGLIVSLAPAKVVWFVPFDTGFRPLGVQSDFDPSAVVDTPLSNPLHATIFWGYVLAALALGTFLLVRRDVD